MMHSRPELSTIDLASTDLAARSDHSLLELFARDGNASAFSMLVERHSAWVYAAAFRQLHDGQLAEDATQATFLLLFQRAKRLGPGHNLGGWLFMTVKFTTKAMLRAQRTRRRHEALAAQNREEAVETPKFTLEMDEAVARLPERLRAAVILRFYQGLEFEQIAQGLGISGDAARKRVGRAVERLRLNLGEAASAEALALAAAYGKPANAIDVARQVNQTISTVAGGQSVSASVLAAASGAVHGMAMAKLMTAATVSLIALVAATAVGSGLYVRMLLNTPAVPANHSSSQVQSQRARGSEGLVFWTARSLYHETGRAEGTGWAATPKDRVAVYLNYGPYTRTVRPGPNVATFRLMADNVLADDTMVVNLDIYDGVTKTQLGDLVVTRRQFKQPNVYQDFEIHFDTPPHSRLEFRTWYSGVCKVNQESVTVRPDRSDTVQGAGKN